MDGNTTQRPGRAGGDKRGNSTDRRNRRAFLLRYHGNGTTAPCTWCGTDLDDSTIEADRIDEGGSYQRSNVVPACRTCNLARSDTPAREYTIVATEPNQRINRTLAKARAAKRTD